MLKINSKHYFVGGFLAGVLLVLAGWGLVSLRGHVGGREIAVEVGGEKLTVASLREKVAEALIPIENDKYQILNEAVEDWIDDQVLQKEAKALDLPLEPLFQEKIWSRVQVDLNDALTEYHQNRELYNQPFERIQTELLTALRNQEYAQQKRKYLGELRQKYHAKNLLPRPDSFVPGLALPSLKMAGTLARAVPAPAPPVPVAAAPAPKVKEHGGAPLPAQPAARFDDLEGRPSVGPKSAAVTIVEFSDFHCPFCQRVQPTMDQLMKTYEGKIRRVWRHYPLAFHQGSDRVHEASECAHEQGKFWEFHGKVFENPQAAKGDEALAGLAKQTGLNEKKFRSCLESGRYKDLIQKEIAKGGQSGVTGTPTFFINGRRISGAQPYDNFDRVVRNELGQ